jgi:hypothetical protein
MWGTCSCGGRIGAAITLSRTSETTRAAAEMAATLPIPVVAMTSRTTASAWTRSSSERVEGAKAALALCVKPRQTPRPLAARRATRKRRGAVDGGSMAMRSRNRARWSSEAHTSVDRRKRSSHSAVQAAHSGDIDSLTLRGCCR